MSENIFDIVVILLFAWSAFRGFTKGLIAGAASFAALLLGIWGAITFSEIVASFLSQHIDLEQRYISIISFGVTFLIIVIVVNLIGKLAEKLAEAIALGTMNKILGAGFGVLKTAFILSVILVILNVINRKSDFISSKFKEGSYFYEPISKMAPSIFHKLNFDEEQLNEKVDNIEI